MWDALRGMLHVACLVFVFLKGAWSCLRWDMDIRARHFFFCALGDCALVEQACRRKART